MHYTWYFNDTSLPGPNSPAYTTSTTGEYKVLVECKDGSTLLCDDWTNKVTVDVDITPPTFNNCPPDVTVECDSIPPVPSVTASDDCDPDPTVTYHGQVRTYGECEDSGTLTRTWTAVDDCGNEATCVQVITIQDTTPPIITCPSDVDLVCDESTDPSNTGTATATDTCDSAVDISYSDSSSDTCLKVITRTWTATDDCGNSASCEQTIPIDCCCEVRGTVTGGGCICEGETESVVLDTTGTVCPGGVVQWNWFKQTGPNSWSVIPGSYMVNPYVTGVAGTYRAHVWCSVGQCDALNTNWVTVVVDTTPPEITCPGDVTVDCDNVPQPGTATAVDNCDPNPIVTYEGETRTDGPCEDSYTLTRTWKAVDRCGNDDYCSQIITVRDITPPEITCPDDVTVDCDNVPQPGTATAVDNCDPNPIVTYEGEVRTDGPCEDSYTLTRTWKAVDRCDNDDYCSQIITVRDITPPEITCPPDLVLEYGESTEPSSSGEATATDNCDDELDITYSDKTIGTCPLMIERTWKATDNCGNSITCVQIITVDDVPKVSVNDAEICEDDSAILTATTSPDTGVSYLWSTGETTQSIVVTVEGTYSVLVTIDANGCQASDSGTLTIYEGPKAEFSNDSPVYLTVPVYFTDLSSPGDWPIVSWAWDFGDSVGTSTQQNPSYTYNAVGTYWVTLTVTDEFGCTDTVRHPVTILPLPTRYICGYVRLDGTTTGLPDAMVELEVFWNGYWTSAGTYTTGPDGFFEFNYTGLMTMFRLTETNPPGYESTYATPIMWGEVINADLIRFNNPPLTPPDLCHFIFYDKLAPGPGPSSIGDYVWHDEDGDGIQDADEEPLARIAVYLKSPDGTIIAVAETDENGLYLFEGLTPGTYHVEVDVDDPDLPYGFAPTTPVLDIVDLGIEEEYRDADFGFNAPCPLCPDWFTFHTDRDSNWEIYRMGSELGVLNLTNNQATDMGPTRSPDALWVAYQSDRSGNWDVFLVRADGVETKQLTYNPANDKDPNWSGECGIRRIAFQSDRDGQWEIYIINMDGTGLRRVTFNDATDSDPFWSPYCSSGKIAFQSDRDGNWNIYIVDVNTGEEHVLMDNPAQDTDPSWSPDGSTIAFISDRDGQREVYVVDVATGSETRISYSEGNESNIAWSPDSFWLAYQSDRDGQWEVYVARSDGQREMRVTENTFVDESPSWDCGSEWIVFHSDMDGNPEIYGINAMTGQGLNRKTDNPANDLCPMWMPSEEDGSLASIIPARGLILAKEW